MDVGRVRKMVVNYCTALLECVGGIIICNYSNNFIIESFCCRVKNNGIKKGFMSRQSRSEGPRALKQR